MALTDISSSGLVLPLLPRGASILVVIVLVTAEIAAIAVETVLLLAEALVHHLHVAATPLARMIDVTETATMTTAADPAALMTETAR